MERNRAMDSLESRRNRNALEINCAECHDAGNHDQQRQEYRQKPWRKNANGRGPSRIPVADLCTSHLRYGWRVVIPCPSSSVVWSHTLRKIIGF